MWVVIKGCVYDQNESENKINNIKCTEEGRGNMEEKLE